VAKLTLSFDAPRSCPRAKQLRQERGLSLSKMVEAYLAIVADPPSPSTSAAPILRSLRGILKNAEHQRVPEASGRPNIDEKRIFSGARVGAAVVIHCKYGAAHGEEAYETWKQFCAGDRSSDPGLLKIDPDTPLDVSTDGKQLIVAPAKPSTRRKNFDAGRNGRTSDMGKAFQKLAE